MPLTYVNRADLYKINAGMLASHFYIKCDRIWEKGPLCDKNHFLFESITRISLF